MKRSTIMGFMLLSIFLALSFGVSAEDKMEQLKKAPGIPPESAVMLKPYLDNESLLNGTLLTDLVPSLKPELGKMALPHSETIAGNTANEPTNILVISNVSFNIIVIQNLTEINTIMPFSLSNATKNITI
jgi:hypothetical protein